jgi:glycosyltransferase domain-containing protein
MLHGQCPILIPTCDREKNYYLQRVLPWIRRFFSPEALPIHILDGGKDHTRQNKELCQQYQATYHELPDMHLIQRYVYALKHLDTELFMICADDDLIHPDGFEAAIKFLLHHPDYSVAHGEYAGFTLIAPKQRIRLYPCNSYGISIEQDTQ